MEISKNIFKNDESSSANKENISNKEGNGITYFGFINKNNVICPVDKSEGDCDIVFLVYYRRDKETYYFKLVDKSEDFVSFANINKMVSNILKENN